MWHCSKGVPIVPLNSMMIVSNGNGRDSEDRYVLAVNTDMMSLCPPTGMPEGWGDGNMDDVEKLYKLAQSRIIKTPHWEREMRRTDIYKRLKRKYSNAGETLNRAYRNLDIYKSYELVVRWKIRSMIRTRVDLHQGDSRSMRPISWKKVKMALHNPFHLETHDEIQAEFKKKYGSHKAEELERKIYEKSITEIFGDDYEKDKEIL